MAKAKQEESVPPEVKEHDLCFESTCWTVDGVPTWRTSIYFVDGVLTVRVNNLLGGRVTSKIAEEKNGLTVKFAAQTILTQENLL